MKPPKLKLVSGIGKPETPKSDHAPTEFDRARAFAKFAEGRLWWLHDRGFWVIWLAGRWQADSSGVGILELFTAFSEKLAKDALVGSSGFEAKGKAIGSALNLQRKRAYDSVLALVKMQPGIAKRWVEFDQAAYLIQFQNGVVDLRTGLLRDALPSDLCLQVAGTSYDAKATCPNFLATLEKASSGDADWVSYLQVWSGYLLTGHSQEEKLHIWHGGGANFKSTVANVFKAVMGDYAAVAAPGMLLNRKPGTPTNDLAALASARVVFISETGENDRLDTGAAKRASSNEAVSCRFLNQEFFSYVPKFKVVISSNHRPVLNDSDDGIWRRLVLVPWLAKISEADKRADFFTAVLSRELAGIAYWMVLGSVRYWAEGLKEPEIIKKSTLGYKAGSDVFSQWLEDCITPCHNQVTTVKLWESFVKWYTLNLGESPKLTSRSLSRWLTDAGYVPFRMATCRGFVGLSLN